MYNHLLFAENLKNLRLLNHSTQQVIADHLNIKRSTYAYYEVGKTEPPLCALCAIAAYFQVNIGYLLGIESADPLYPGSQLLENKEEMFKNTPFR